MSHHNPYCGHCGRYHDGEPCRQRDVEQHQREQEARRNGTYTPPKTPWWDIEGGHV